MPTRELAPIRETESGLAQRLAPEVLSKATPTAKRLLEARAYIRVTPEVQEFFRRAREENRGVQWLADNLTLRFSGIWGYESFEESQQVGQWLADEFFQLGEAIQVVSSVTGKVEALLSEGDLYQPGPLLREDGSVAQTPLARIRPELEANLITWTVEREREKQVLQALATRAFHTDLQREEGDPRLLVATRRGRSSIVRTLTQERPKKLLGACEGTSAAFLRHFKISEVDLSDPDLKIASSRSTMGIQDQTTSNLNYSRSVALRKLLPQGWVRDIAFQLSVKARDQKRVAVIPEEELDARDLEGFPFWVAPPEAIPVIRLLAPHAAYMPVEGSCLIGFPEKIVGELEVGTSFTSESHEMSDKWEVVGNLPYNMKVDLCQVRTLTISGIGVEGHLVERLS